MFVGAFGSEVVLAQGFREGNSQRLQRSKRLKHLAAKVTSTVLPSGSSHSIRTIFFGGLGHRFEQRELEANEAMLHSPKGGGGVG